MQYSMNPLLFRIFNTLKNSPQFNDPGMSKAYPVYLWKQAPFIRLLPALAVGILTGYFFYIPFRVLVAVTCIGIVSVLVFEWMNVIRKFRWRMLSGLSYLALIFLSGVILFKVKEIRFGENWYGHYLDDADVLQIVLCSTPESRNKSFKVRAEVTGIFSGDSLIRTKGRAMFYFSKDSSAQSLKAGDILVVKNRLRPIRNSGNPGAFDYEKFMAFQNIYHQAFISADSWRATGGNTQNLIEKTLSSSVDYSHRTFERFLKDRREVALSKALLTGDRSELDRDLVQAYANTGVVHIMAISGLHLGLIYILLVRLCSLIPIVKDNRYIRFVLILCAIWFFAVMTGSSPSVMRSAVMFSFLALSILKKRKIAIYNFWAAAAFILLCVRPKLLFNVGFQLSFLAVLGILVVQRPVYRQMRFENKLIDYIWQLISVTLSAQLFTLPLCLYYFHQFPGFFILANLVAIPLATVGLWAGVLLLMTSWLPLLGKVFGSIADTAFRWMNSYIQFMNSLEFSVWKTGWVTVAETIVLSLLIIFLTTWLLRKRKIYFRFALICMIALPGLIGVRSLALQRQQRMVVYNIPNATVIDFIEGNKYRSEIFTPTDEGESFRPSEVIQARQFFNVAEEEDLIPDFAVGENRLFIKRQSVYHVKSNRKYPRRGERIKLDVIIISGSPKIKIAELHRVFDAKLYVFAPSNKRYQTEQWKKECEELHLHSHDVANEGALVLNY